MFVKTRRHPDEIAKTSNGTGRDTEIELIVIKTLIYLIILLFSFTLTQGEHIICKDATPGGIYIVGPDVSDDSLTGRFLYYSADYGTTLVITDEDTAYMGRFAHISADANVGGIYRASGLENLYYSSDYGESWSLQSGDCPSKITSGISPGEIYKARYYMLRSTDFGESFSDTGGVIPFTSFKVGCVRGELFGIMNSDGMVYYSSDSCNSFDLMNDLAGGGWSITRGAIPGEVYCYNGDSIYYSSDYGSTYVTTGNYSFSEICGGNSTGELFGIREEYYTIPMIGQFGGEIEICYSDNYGATFNCIFYSSRDAGIIEYNINTKQENIIINLYPNPFSINLSIKTKANYVKILDIIGKTIVEFDNLNEEITWSPRKIPAGIYLIQAINDKKIETKKVFYTK